MRSPIERGIVTNWDDMEQVLYHSIYNKLNLSLDARPLLLAEPPLNPKANRARITELMFETFNVPAFYLEKTAVLSLYAAGLMTGCVVESGDGVTFTVPVYEGFAFPHAINVLEMGGRDITSHLWSTLTEKSYHLSKCRSSVHPRRIKEKLSCISLESGVLCKLGGKSDYELPDGTKVTIEAERVTCSESLFNPSLLIEETWKEKSKFYLKTRYYVDEKQWFYGGIHDATYDTIMKTDIDLHKDMYANIVLGGGNMMFPGIRERMTREITNLAPSSTEIKVIAPPSNSSRKLSISCWSGGSVLASLSSFKHMWISEDEYNETGPSIVHRKCC